MSAATASTWRRRSGTRAPSFTRKRPAPPRRRPRPGWMKWSAPTAGTWPTSSPEAGRCRLAVVELRLPLLGEGGHAFLLVLGGEQRVEHAPFKQHALSKP